MIISSFYFVVIFLSFPEYFFRTIHLTLLFITSIFVPGFQYSGSHHPSFWFIRRISLNSAFKAVINSHIKRSYLTKWLYMTFFRSAWCYGWQMIRVNWNWDENLWFSDVKLRIWARKVLRLSPRISEAPFFSLTFHWVFSSTRTMWSRSTVSSVYEVVVKCFWGLSRVSIRRSLFSEVLITACW